MAYLGIDLGGTKTALGIVNNKGEITHNSSFPSVPNDFETYYLTLEKEIRAFLEASDIKSVKAIGVGCAGQIELKEGLIFHSPNLNWTNAPLGAKLRESFPDAKVTIDNDVRAATLGEFLFGMEKRPSIYINIFLGTGIGSGIILHNRILRGHSNSAGEIGLTSILHDGVRSSSGNRGVYEYYASGTALGRYGKEMAQEQLEESPRNVGGPRLCDQVESVEAITGKLVGELASQGNQDAVGLVKKVAYFIGVGMTNVINFLNPEVITYGGGLSGIGNILTDTMISTIKERAIATAFENCKIQPASLGNDAGIIGSAFLHLVDEQGKISKIS